MILISHRGNINGPNLKLENNPKYLDIALYNGYNVEVDVWFLNGSLYSGHDEPQYILDSMWIIERLDRLWIHCKNIDSIIHMKEFYDRANYFWHENDTITLTSKNHIWAFPGKQPIKNSIAVMPEIHDENVSMCLGVCSDYVQKFKIDF